MPDGIGAHMGAAPAFNITVNIPASETAKLMDAIADEFDKFEYQEAYDEYEFTVPDEMDAGRLGQNNDSILLGPWEGDNEYYGFGSGTGLAVHYSPYYFEDMESLKMKLEFLDKVKQFIDNWNPSGQVKYIACTCTV